jgi:hypothetical protein
MADHIVPLARGGDPLGKLRVLCRSCNSRRGGNAAETRSDVLWRESERDRRMPVRERGRGGLQPVACPGGCGSRSRECGHLSDTLFLAPCLASRSLRLAREREAGVRGSWMLPSANADAPTSTVQCPPSWTRPQGGNADEVDPSRSRGRWAPEGHRCRNWRRQRIHHHRCRSDHRHTLAPCDWSRRPWPEGPVAAPHPLRRQHEVVASVLPRGRLRGRGGHRLRDCRGP